MSFCVKKRLLLQSNFPSKKESRDYHQVRNQRHGSRFGNPDQHRQKSFEARESRYDRSSYSRRVRDGYSHSERQHSNDQEWGNGFSNHYTDRNKRGFNAPSNNFYGHRQGYAGDPYSQSRHRVPYDSWRDQSHPGFKMISNSLTRTQ